MLQRRPAVDNVLDDDDVLTVNREIEIVQETHLARCAGPLRVARGGYEIEREIAGNLPDQIGQKDEGPLEDRHQMELFGEVATELPGQFGDALLNLVLRE